jgi:hypothetical protein
VFPEAQLREWAAPTDSSSEELGNNSCSARRAKSQSCLLLIEPRNRDTSSESRPASDLEALELAGLQAPLSTLRLEPRDASRMTRGHQRKDQDRRPIFKCALNRQFAAIDSTRSLIPSSPKPSYRFAGSNPHPSSRSSRRRNRSRPSESNAGDRPAKSHITYKVFLLEKPIHTRSRLTSEQ